MSSTGKEFVFGIEVDVKAIDAIRSFWKESKMHSKPMYKFDTLAKGWDRLAAELWPTKSMGHRFKKLTGYCSAMSRTQSVDDLFLKFQVQSETTWIRSRVMRKKTLTERRKILKNTGTTGLAIKI